MFKFIVFLFVVATCSVTQAATSAYYQSIVAVSMGMVATQSAEITPVIDSVVDPIVDPVVNPIVKPVVRPIKTIKKNCASGNCSVRGFFGRRR